MSIQRQRFPSIQALKPLLGLLAAALALPGCNWTGLSKTQGAGSPAAPENCSTSLAPTTSGIEAFKISLYPQLRRDCAGCHGVSQTPRFAVTHESEAYQAARTAVNFTDLAASAFLRKAKDGHCGTLCAMDGSEMRARLEQWKAAETPGVAANCDPGGNQTSSDSQPGTAERETVTAPISLPSPLPTGTAFTELRFDLGSLTPTNPELAGVVFQVEIQSFTSPRGVIPGSYRFRKPKLATPTHPVYVKGVRLIVNGTPDSGDEGFAEVEMAVSPQRFPPFPEPLPFPVLSSDIAIVLQQNADGSDRIAVAFEKIEKTEALNCRNLSLFQSAVRPVMQNRCFSCHQNTANTGYKKFSMSGTDEQLCLRSLQRTDRSEPDLSPLLAQPYRQLYGHPATQLTLPEADSWLPWIRSEH